ncbi:putative Heterokaryon incompatibility protein [Seiridium unicorne]|uniref:Heterokaryon incompatibility protein n=1 Tax=Seiridium unicorne TaxID=138068 RepID=A0ABR2UK88_9PEZI
MDFDIHHHYADERGFLGPDILMMIIVYHKPRGVVATTPAPNAQFLDIHFDDKDNPYRVVKAEFDPQAGSFKLPLLPILQFLTWHTHLYVYPDERNGIHNAQAGRKRHHVAELDDGWAAGPRDTSQSREFIAIPEAKKFAEAECSEWTYYIPKEREQSEWDLFYVLLVERTEERW